MTIEFTNEEFENLLKLSYLGNWMVNSIHTEDERARAFEEILQRLYASAKEAHLSHLAHYDETQGTYVATEALELGDDIQGWIDEYDGEVFWGELTQRLAMRDFLRFFGPQASMMGMKEQTEKRHELLERYVTEFEANGVENVVISDAPYEA